MALTLAGLALASTIAFFVCLRRDAKAQATPEPVVETAAPAAAAPRPAPPAPKPVASTPGRPITVAPASPEFTGRVAEVEEAKRSLAAGGVTMIHGGAPQGGLGKTALAGFVIHGALAAGRFPDGAVAIDLKGSSDRPLSPRDALYRLLSDIGVAVGAPPADADERRVLSMLSYQWRRETTNRDMVVLLDDARDAEQIDRLAPGPGATLIVTSQAPIAIADARQIGLGPMPRDEALALTTKLAPDLPEAAATRLVALAPDLPLAIETGALGVARSSRAPARCIVDLSTSEQGDPEGRAQRFLGRVVDQLDEDLAAAWSALSLFEDGFFAEAAATLWGVPREEAERWLNRLHHRRLVSPVPLVLPFERVLGRRWRLHGALRSVASERLAADPRAGDAWMGWLRAMAAMTERAGRLYEVGGDGAAHGLALLDLELSGVVSAAEEASGLVDRDNAAADVAMRLPRWRVLATRLDSATLSRFVAAGLIGARRLGDPEAERQLEAMGALAAGLGSVYATDEEFLESVAAAEAAGDAAEASFSDAMADHEATDDGVTVDAAETDDVAGDAAAEAAEDDGWKPFDEAVEANARESDESVYAEEAPVELSSDAAEAELAGPEGADEALSGDEQEAAQAPEATDQSDDADPSEPVEAAESEAPAKAATGGAPRVVDLDEARVREIRLADLDDDDEVELGQFAVDDGDEFDVGGGAVSLSAARERRASK